MVDRLAVCLRVWLLVGLCVPRFFVAPVSSGQAPVEEPRELPDAVLVVVRAVEAKLRGRDVSRVPVVAFTGQAAEQQVEADFRYNSFRLTHVELRHFQAVPESPGLMALVGRLGFTDGWHRYAEALFTAGFRIDILKQRIVIENLQTLPANAVKPRVEVYLVPEAILTLEQFHQPARSHGSLDRKSTRLNSSHYS